MRRLLTGNDTLENLVHAAATRAAYGVDGSGLSAAMIDTGVDYTNPALGGDGYGPGHKVIDGFDFSKNSPNPYPVDAHGTSTAGIVASTDATYPGIAPGSNIVSLRIFGDDGSGDFDRVAAALQYAIDHHEQDHISVVNISISDGGNYSYDFFSHDNSIGQKLAGLIHQLHELDIPVVVAAGNSYDGTPGMGFPAVLSETVSVAATDGHDAFLGNAQRLGARDGFGAATDLVAPGKDFTAPTSDRRWTTVEGSSFSAPIVTGGILLLQQIYEKWYGTLPKVDDLVAWLKGGGTVIHDNATATDYDRLDILKSASLIPKPAGAEAGSTQVYVDGTLRATVPSTTTANPLSDFGADAGFQGNFNLIQIWQGSQSTTINLPGDSDPLGSLFSKVEIYNSPQTAGKLDPVPAAASTVSVKTHVRQMFTPTVATRTPRPSRFARRGHHQG